MNLNCLSRVLFSRVCAFRNWRCFIKHNDRGVDEREWMLVEDHWRGVWHSSGPGNGFPSTSCSNPSTTTPLRGKGTSCGMFLQPVNLVGYISTSFILVSKSYTTSFTAGRIRLPKGMDRKLKKIPRRCGQPGRLGLFPFLFSTDLEPDKRRHYQEFGGVQLQPIYLDFSL